MYNRPLAFRIKGDFGTVYITANGIVDTAPEGVPFVSNIHVDDDIIDRDSFRHHLILKHFYELLDHKYRSDGSIDNIDITTYYSSYRDHYEIDIIIYHGNIEVSNTLGHKALLKEVYTKTFIHADEKGMRFKNLKMFRSRLNATEASDRFQHSHSQRQYMSSPDWVHMCLGDSELYTHFFKRKRKYTDMSLYCVYLDAYLAWESREGGPYSTIEYVYNSPSIQIDNANLNDVDIDRIIYDNADVFEVVESNNTITVSSDFINKIEIDGIPKQNGYQNYLNFDNLNMINEVYKDPIRSCCKFRNKELLLTVEDTDKEEILPYISTLYNRIPDKLVDMIKERISSIINLNYANNTEETVRTVGVGAEG